MERFLCVCKIAKNYDRSLTSVVIAACGEIFGEFFEFCKRQGLEVATVCVGSVEVGDAASPDKVIGGRE